MNDIITSKISIIKKCLTRIKEKTNLNPESIENDFDIQDIFVLNLQRAIQATIDISNYIIKENKLDLSTKCYLLLLTHLCKILSISDLWISKYTINFTQVLTKKL